MKRILTIAALMIAASPLAFGQKVQSPAGQTTTAGKTSGGAAEREVLKFNIEYGQAYVSGDLAALGRFLADEFTSTGTTGEVSDKARTIESLKIGDLKVESGRDDDVRAHIYGDMAVVTGLWTSKGQEKGKTFNRADRYTAVFVKRDGRWQVVAEHSTTVAAQPQSH